LVVQQIGEHIRVKVQTCAGATLVLDEIKALKEGVHVVVGTPGRVFDLMEKGFLKSDYLKIFVLDEADAIFSGGFEQQINDIFKYLPN
jgi:translation initiation factor 4A